MPRRNKYILENMSLNIFKFYILKCIIKFLQSRDNDKKKKFGFVISRNTCKKLESTSTNHFSKFNKQRQEKKKRISFSKENSSIFRSHYRFTGKKDIFNVLFHTGTIYRHSFPRRKASLLLRPPCGVKISLGE